MTEKEKIGYTLIPVEEEDANYKRFNSNKRVYETLKPLHSMVGWWAIPANLKHLKGAWVTGTDHIKNKGKERTNFANTNELVRYFFSFGKLQRRLANLVSKGAQGKLIAIAPEGIKLVIYLAGNGVVHLKTVLGAEMKFNKAEFTLGIVEL